MSSSFLRRNHSSHFRIDIRNTLRSKQRPLREALSVWQPRVADVSLVAQFIAEAPIVIKIEERVLSAYQNICESIAGRECWPNKAPDAGAS